MLRGEYVCSSLVMVASAYHTVVVVPVRFIHARHHRHSDCKSKESGTFRPLTSIKCDRGMTFTCWHSTQSKRYHVIVFRPIRLLLVGGAFVWRL